MVKFDRSEDREKVIMGGPWMLSDNYIAVKSWTPDFNPSDGCFGRTMLWVRLESLNMMYFEESAMKTIMSGIGKPIKIDFTTRMMERGNFARACVEVDLSKPVARKIWIQDHWHEVLYESLHLICKRCDCYGHLERDCKAAPEMFSFAQERSDGAGISEEAPVTKGEQSKNPASTDSIFQKNSNTKSKAIDVNDLDGWTVVNRRKSRSNIKGKNKDVPMHGHQFSHVTQRMDSKRNGHQIGESSAMHVNSKNVKIGEDMSKVHSLTKETSLTPGSKASAVKPSGVIKGGCVMRTGRLVVKGMKQISPRQSKPKRARMESNASPPAKDEQHDVPERKFASKGPSHEAPEGMNGSYLAIEDGERVRTAT